VLQRTVSIHEHAPNSSGDGDELGPCLLEEVVPYRQFTAQEIELLGMLTGLEVSHCQRQCMTGCLFGQNSHSQAAYLDKTVTVKPAVTSVGHLPGTLTAAGY
jgi:hypothetical protein